jgi:hypothetical protein
VPLITSRGETTDGRDPFDPMRQPGVGVHNMTAVWVMHAAELSDRLDQQRPACAHCSAACAADQCDSCVMSSSLPQGTTTPTCHVRPGHEPVSRRKP